MQASLLCRVSTSPSATAGESVKHMQESLARIDTGLDPTIYAKRGAVAVEGVPLYINLGVHSSSLVIL
jgi:hypothetical protein